jgi:hypothetical protein
MTSWLSGMLAIASIIMVIGLGPLVKAELHESSRPWYRNKALRISLALYIHGIGAVVLFASPLMAGVEQTAGVALYLLWAALGMWLLAKTLIISAVSKRIGLTIALFVGWTAGCAAWSLFGGIG